MTKPKISPKTREVLEAIKADPAQRGIIAHSYTWAFRNAAAVAAAFKIAKREGILVVDYYSAAGNPVYRKGSAWQ